MRLRRRRGEACFRGWGRRTISRPRRRSTASNSIVARAVGPALAGVIIAVAGVGAAFALNAVSFAGVIVLVARWKRPVRRHTTPPETLAGATVAALRYVRFSPSLRVLMLRSGLTMLFASALLALMPSVAKTVSGSP